MNRPVRSTLMTMALASVGFAQINARRINQQDRDVGRTLSPRGALSSAMARL
jgi:hypothetical protein